jgi:hypothetical protein
MTLGRNRQGEGKKDKCKARKGRAKDGILTLVCSVGNAVCSS